MSVDRLKIVAIGDDAVGKTCLLIRFGAQTYPHIYVPTVYENRVVEHSVVDGVPCEIALWDTGGRVKMAIFVY